MLDKVNVLMDDCISARRRAGSGLVFRLGLFSCSAVHLIQLIVQVDCKLDGRSRLQWLILDLNPHVFVIKLGAEVCT